MAGSFGDLFMIVVVTIAIFWVVYSAGRYAGLDISSYLNQNTLTQPLVPFVQFLQETAAKTMTLEVGLFAFLLIIIIAIKK